MLPWAAITIEFVVRIDQNISDKQHLFARYTILVATIILPSIRSGPASVTTAAAEIFNTNSFVIDDVYVLSPTTTLDVRGELPALVV